MRRSAKKKNDGEQPNPPDIDGAAPSPSKTSRILPMQLQIGDRLTDATGEYKVIGQPYTAKMGKDVHVRVKRVDNAEVTMVRSYAAHERIVVRRE